MQTVVAAIFAVWLLATVLQQFSETRVARLIRRLDLLKIVPGYLFFCPGAWAADIHLVVGSQRHEDDSFTYGEMPTAAPLPRRGVWHPARRRMMTVIHCFRALRRLPQDGTSPIEESLAYRVLLNLARLYAPSESVATRFAVFETDRSAEPELFLRSLIHTVHGRVPR